MSGAFDAAARGAGGGRAGGGRAGGSGGGGAFGAAAAAPRAGSSASGFGAASAGAPAAAAAAAYQGADRLYTSACDAVEKELRKLTTLTSTLKKGADAIGGPRDSADVRAKVKAGVAKGAEAVRALGVMLKSDLAPSTDAADLSARERTARKQQLQRYMGDYKAAADAFEDASRAAGAAERKAPAPPKAGGRGGAPEDAAAAREEEALLARLQAVDFDASLVDERDAAITNIASTIVEVNETMRDLAALVEEQGKDIEVIESNVTEAADRTSKGVDELTTAAKYQKGYRRWILIFILIICAVAGGVTAYVVIQQKQKSK